MKQICTPKDIYDLINPLLKNEKQENVVIILMDNLKRVRSIIPLYVGDARRVIFSPRPIIEKALANNAWALAMVHNHPSGSPLPSQYDIKETQRLKEALHIFDIEFIDHIIIGHNRFYSFADEKQIEDNSIQEK